MKKVSGFYMDTLLGAAAGIPVGALLLAGERTITPPGVMQFPEEAVDMPVAGAQPPKPKAPKKAPAKKKDDTEKKAGLYSALPGAALGAGAGYRVASELWDRVRSKKLDAMIAQREAELNDMLMQEQTIAGGLAKRSEVDEALATIGEQVYDELEKSAASTILPGQEALNVIKQLPAVTKDVLKALALAAGLGGGYMAYSRAAEADPRRARVASMKKLLRERLSRGDNQGPMILKVRSAAPAMTPVRPDATSLAPGMGRDVLEGI